MRTLSEEGSLLGDGSSSTSERPPVVPGYEILGELGRGGMGVVYQARQTGLNRQVALKMILHGDHASGADLARFKTEVEAVARVQHSHIVQIYEVNAQNGLPYYSLEYCAGGSLSKKLAGTPLPPQEAAILVEVLARAMDTAHRAGIIHRDLKPANVLLTADGTPKVSDFGLAKKLEDSGQTASGALLGTPSYMAPEQAAGQTRTIGPAADVYALGAILYECLTGRPPFKAATRHETIQLVLSADPVPPGRLQPKLPRDLETICLKCLHKEPHKRYASALELAQDLRHFGNHEPITARPVSRAERLRRWCRRNPARAVSAAVAVLSLIIGTALISYFAVQARSSERQARRHLYAAQMNLAQAAIREGQLSRAVELLRGQEPQPGQPDLRGFEWHYLWRLCHSYRHNLTTHQGGVSNVLFSPDGQTVATTGWDGTVRIRDVRSGRETLVFQGHSQEVWSAAFSPDGKWLASAGGNPTTATGAVTEIRVWNVATGEERLHLKGPFRVVWSVAISPDGKYLAAGGTNQIIKVWDFRSGEEVARCTGEIEKMDTWAITFSSDSRRLVSAHGDGTLRVWDAGTGRQLSKITGHESWVHSVACSPDGSYLASSGGDNTVRLWDSSTGTLIRTRGHTRAIWAVAFSSDSKHLASAGDDRVVKVWAVANGEEVFVLRGHDAGVRGVVFSPDGQQIATASWDGTAKIWDATDPAVSQIHHQPTSPDVTTFCFSPDGRRLATCGGTVKMWDIASRQTEFTLPGNNKDMAAVGVAVSADGERLIAPHPNGLNVWNTKTGAKISAWNTPNVAVALNPAKNRAACASTDGTVVICDAETGQHQQILRGHVDGVWSVAYSPGGKYLASGGYDSMVKIWDGATGQELCTCAGHTGRVLSVAFSPDGKLLASASSVLGRDRSVGGEVIVWDPATGQKLFTLSGHPSGAFGVSFSPDGNRLASAGFDQTVKTWDVHDGHEVLTLANPVGQAGGIVNLNNWSRWNVDFSPDGSWLAASSYGGVIRLWNISPVSPLRHDLAD